MRISRILSLFAGCLFLMSMVMAEGTFASGRTYEREVSTYRGGHRSPYTSHGRSDSRSHRDGRSGYPGRSLSRSPFYRFGGSVGYYNYPYWGIGPAPMYGYYGYYGSPYFSGTYFYGPYYRPSGYYGYSGRYYQPQYYGYPYSGSYIRIHINW